MRIEKAITDNWSVMSKYDPSHRAKLVIDEWGVWYSASPEVAPGFNLSQNVSLRDAVHTAMHFDIFNRHADKIGMANVAQIINCLHSLSIAHEDKYVRTPVYHVFDMYKNHMGARLVPARLTAGDLTVPVLGSQTTLPGLSVSDSVRNGRMTVTLTNPLAENEIAVRLRIAGSLRPARNAGNAVVPRANERRQRLRPASLCHAHGDGPHAFRKHSDRWLPKQSVAALSLKLA